MTSLDHARALMAPLARDLLESLSGALSRLGAMSEGDSMDATEAFGPPVMSARVLRSGATSREVRSIDRGESRWREECLRSAVSLGWLALGRDRRESDGRTMWVPVWSARSPGHLRAASALCGEAPEAAVRSLALSGRGSGEAILRWCQARVEAHVARLDAQEAGATEADLEGIPSLPSYASMRPSVLGAAHSLLASGAFPRAGSELRTVLVPAHLAPEVYTMLHSAQSTPDRPSEVPSLPLTQPRLRPSARWLQTAVTVLLSSPSALPPEALFDGPAESPEERRWRSSALQALVVLGWASRSDGALRAADPAALWDLGRAVKASPDAPVPVGAAQIAPALEALRASAPPESRPAPAPPSPAPVRSSLPPAGSSTDPWAASLASFVEHLLSQKSPTPATHSFRRVPGSDQVAWRTSCVLALEKFGLAVRRSKDAPPLSAKWAVAPDARPLLEGALRTLRSPGSSVSPLDVEGSLGELVPRPAPPGTPDGWVEARDGLLVKGEAPAAQEPEPEPEPGRTPRSMRSALAAACRYLHDRAPHWKSSGVRLQGDPLDQVLLPSLVRGDGAVHVRRLMLQSLVQVQAARCQDGRLWSSADCDPSALEAAIDALENPGPGPERLRGWAPRALWSDLVESDLPGEDPEFDAHIERSMWLRLRAEPFRKWTVSELFGGSVDVSTARSAWRRERVQSLLSRGVISPVGDKSSVWHLTDPPSLSQLIDGQSPAPVPQPEPEEVGLPVEDDNTLLISHLSFRTCNALRDAGVATVGDLVQLDEKRLLRLDGFGKRCLKEVRHLLWRLGLSLASDRPTVDPGGPASRGMELAEPGTLTSFEDAVLRLHSSEAFLSREEIFARAPLGSTVHGTEQLSYLKSLTAAGLLESRGSSRWVRWRPVAERREDLLQSYEDFLPRSLVPSTFPDEDDLRDDVELEPAQDPEPVRSDAPSGIEVPDLVAMFQENLSSMLQVVQSQADEISDLKARLAKVEAALAVKEGG